jgi:DNA-binding MarR family transcriptional regulator
LIALKDKGLVDIAVMEADRRKRTVKFTPLAEDLFNRLA